MHLICKDLTDLWEQLQLVGNQHHGFISQEPLNAPVKDVLTGVLVYSRQGIVQQDQISVMIGSTGQAHPLALATRKVDTPFARHGGVSC
jgi:hypothetical protein